MFLLQMDFIPINLESIFLLFFMHNREEMDVHKMSKKPLCMNQYARLFAGCRVPGREVDKLKVHFKPGNGSGVATSRLPPPPQKKQKKFFWGQPFFILGRGGHMPPSKSWVLITLPLGNNYCNPDL